MKKTGGNKPLWFGMIAALCTSALMGIDTPAIAQITAQSMAQTSVKLVQQGKRATALVVVKATNDTGTAFCVGSDGYFITNEHVTENAHGQVTLLLHPGAADQQTFQARLLDSDKDADLSLLKIDGATGLTALPLGIDTGLMETDPVIAFGYPFGTDLALSDDSYPSVTVSLGHITALRRDKHGLQYLQLDASLNPGNSGGPVLDAKGKVVGVVEAGVPGAALNFAIPVHILEAFLRRPLIVFSPQLIPRMQASQPQHFEIAVNPLFPDKIPPAVLLSLITPHHPQWRSFVAKRTGPSRYEVSAVPVPRVPGPRRLWVIGLNPSARPSAMNVLSAEVLDRAITIRDHPFLLSDLGSVTFHAGQTGTVETGTVEMEDGDMVPGPVTGLTAVPVYVHDVKQIVNFTQYEQVKVVDLFKMPSSVSYTVVVRDQSKNRGNKSIGEIVGSLHGEIALSDQPLPASQSALPRKPGDGLLIVCADAGPTSDLGFTTGPVDASAHFVRNLVHAFSARPGDFLTYFGTPINASQAMNSTNAASRPYATQFEQTVEHNARRVSGLALPGTLHFPGILRFYGAVFIRARSRLDWPGLTDYLAHGGQVYLTISGKLTEADWKIVNSFLAPYGLNVRPGPQLEKPIVERGFVNSSLFEGVSGLLIQDPADIKVRPGSWPNTQLISADGGVGYIAAVRIPTHL